MVKVKNEIDIIKAEGLGWFGTLDIETDPDYEYSVVKISIGGTSYWVDVDDVIMACENIKKMKT